MKRYGFIALALLGIASLGFWTSCNKMEYIIPDTEEDSSSSGGGSGADVNGNFSSILSVEEASRKQSLDSSFDPSKNLLKSGALLSSLEYVVLLYKEGSRESRTRGDAMLNTIIACQNTKEGDTYYGVWPWYPDQKATDRNSPVFMARRMLGQLWPMKERMSQATQLAFDAACKRLVYAAEHRFDDEIWPVGRSEIAYTNVFSMYVETLTIAGIRYNDERLKRLAKSQWTKFYNNFEVHGIDEFMSPDYDNVTFSALLSTYGYVGDSSQKKEIKEVLDYIYTLEAAATHPVLNTPIVGISRDPRTFVNGSDARVDFLKKTPEGYDPPAEAVQLLRSKSYPFSLEGRAGAQTFTFKSYQTADAGMGSMTGWGNYYSQQVHCMASVGKSTSQRATLFVPGSYIHVNGFTDQKELSTLCVYNRLPTMYHHQQWNGNLNNIGETFFEFGIGLSTQFNTVKQDSGDIVFRAWGYDFHIRPFYIENGQVKYCSLTKRDRTKSSQKYHVKDLKFTEYVFPNNHTWFGAYISVTKENTNVTLPTVTYSGQDGLDIFSTSEGHRIAVARTDPGVSVHVRDEDPYSKERYIIK